MVTLVNSTVTPPRAAVASEPNWNRSSQGISVMKMSLVSKVKVCSSVVKSMPSETRGSQLP